jgi:hypothetical protein
MSEMVKYRATIWSFLKLMALFFTMSDIVHNQNNIVIFLFFNQNKILILAFFLNNLTKTVCCYRNSAVLFFIFLTIQWLGHY